MANYSHTELASSCEVCAARDSEACSEGLRDTDTNWITPWT